jgi:hypothetical protein
MAAALQQRPTARSKKHVWRPNASIAVEQGNERTPRETDAQVCADQFERACRNILVEGHEHVLRRLATVLGRLAVQRNPLFILLNCICEALGLDEQVRHRVP